ncbi:MAG: tRNA uridine-5-carboxymethylaminomethyl(34) synthesis GTPase MnmE [Cyanobacteria bacterium SIG29]|nr:tRNA uridine-5-carboxymethylaminomethyl(34) synthesis GTPase MnmE [Cyanobacteria bacterium SIG29]
MEVMIMEDTIAAVVTAAGESSVGIIRLSGADALKIASNVYHGKADLINAPSHTIHYGHVYDPKNDKIIDEALFMLMRGPRSFTGEDVVEIQCHGGILVVRNVLQLVLANGARLAEQGEYSKRAFLNGRLDLAQAESIMDIVQARSDKGIDLALNQLNGNLSDMVRVLRQDLLELVAFIQADIDYPDDDIERLSLNEMEDRVEVIKTKIEKVLLTAKKGKMIKDGLKVVIAGQPNVGKSSLMNALLGTNRAIVTNIPGTTRDFIEEYLQIGGIPVKLIDTAGIRETDNIVEKIGVDKAHEFLESADLILYVLDGSQSLQEKDKNLLDNIADKQVIFLLNKQDLGISSQLKDELNIIKKENIVLEISAMEERGITELEQKIIDLCFAGDLTISNTVTVSNARHIQILEDCLNHFQGFLNGARLGLSVDFLVIDLQNAWEKLGKIIGESVEEDLLNQIFSQFCLGK